MMVTLKYIPIRIKYLLILSLFFSLSLISVKAQDSSIQIIKIAVPKFKYFYTDRLSDLYVTTQDNQLNKYNKRGELAFKYNENRYDTISVVDLNNPLQILLFYSSFGVLQILDRNLALQSELQLKQLGYQTITAAGLAADNNIWIYDAEKFRLVKLDPFGKVIKKSNELIGLIGDNRLMGQIWEQDNFLFIRASGIGWLQFDDFASFIQIIPIPDMNIIRIEAEKIWYMEDGEVNQFDLATLHKKLYPVPGLIGKFDFIDQRPALWVKSLGEEIFIYKER